MRGEAVPSTTSDAGFPFPLLLFSLQVPYHLTAVCCRNPSTVAAMSRLLVAALEVFLGSAQLAGCIKYPAGHHAADNNPNALSLSIGRQLEQAGLLACVPAITAAAAGDLLVLPEPAEVADQLQEADGAGQEDSSVEHKDSWRVCQRTLLSKATLSAALRCVWDVYVLVCMSARKQKQQKLHVMLPTPCRPTLSVEHGWDTTVGYTQKTCQCVHCK